MLKWFIICVVIAIVAGIFGFGGISDVAAGFAKIIFFIFIVGAIIFLLIWKKIF